MADKHPYISGTGGLVKAIQQFRSSLPAKIDAAVLKKLGIAPKNESYLINILRFLSVIDDEGTSTPEGRTAFTQHDDAAFAKKFGELIKKAYSDLFSLHGGKTWELKTDALITYFRQNDQTTTIVGGRQATTFQILAAFAGHGEVPSVRTSTPPKAKTDSSITKPKPAAKSITKTADTGSAEIDKRTRDLGLTVRIEINLPASGDQATYDRIFKSIKENLLNG